MIEENVAAALHCMHGDAFARYIGTEILDIEPGYARVRLQLHEKLLNFVKIPHGAVVFAVADQAFAAASNAQGMVSVALNVNITFLKAASQDDILYAEARMVSDTRRTSSFLVEVTNQDGVKIALFQGLAYRKSTRVTEIVPASGETE